MLQVPAQTDGPHPLHVTGKQVLQLGPVSAVPSMCERAARCPSLHWTPPVHRAAGCGPLDCLSMHTGPAWRTLVVFKAPLVRRSDAVPRLSYSSVEGIFVELVNASPVRKAMQDVSRK